MTNPTAWSRGYPVSEVYPPSWHDFQSPAHLHLVCALMGVTWEVSADTPMSIAEVGCGTGFTAAVLAAGNPNAEVMGLDYNPAHIAEARSLARAAGLKNLRYQEADLAELSDAELDRLPEFDLITVHGVWSWVADPVRDGVLRLLRRRLKPGGVALVSYNALPAAAGSLGLSRVARGAMLGAADSIDGVAAASRMVEKLIAAEAAHLPPSGWRRLFTGEAPGARPGYVLHEFLTEHWRPSFFADVAAAMGTARCEFVGSATIDENFPQMSLSPAQCALWDEAPDEAGRQMVLDLCAPRAFRRDVYVRGLRRMPRDPAVSAITLALATHASGEFALKTQAGVAQLPKALIEAVRGALLDGPKTIAALRALPGCGKTTPSELVAMLVASGMAVPVWQTASSTPQHDQAVATARRFNGLVADRHAPHGVGAGRLSLTTPHLGGGLAVSALELAVAKRVAQAAAEVPAVEITAAWVASRLTPEGATPPPEILEELVARVAEVLHDKLPVWRSLGLV